MFMPARDRQFRAPPVLDALVFDVAAGLETPDLVGAGAERRFQRRLVEILHRVIGARKDRQRRDEQRHVASALGRKAHDDGIVVLGFGADHIARELPE